MQIAAPKPAPKNTVLDVDALLKDAHKLIRVPSITSDITACNAAVHFIHTKLAAIPGVTIEVFERNDRRSLLAYWGPVRPLKFKVLFNAHLDVVDAPPALFTSHEEAGYLYGRGADDMKTAALVLTELFCDMVPHVNYPLGLQIVTDEEIGTYDGTKFQLEQGVDTEFVLGGDTTNFGISTRSKGILWAQLEFHGTAAHGAYPWRGKNALLRLNNALNQLLAVYPVPDQEAWRTIINVARIETTNDIFNLIPDNATLKLDVRYLPDDPHFKNQESAEAFLQSMSPEADVAMLLYEPPHFASEDNPFVTLLAQSFSKVTGNQPQLLHQSGASDIRYFSARDIPGVNFSLRGEGAHSAQERIQIDSIPQYYDIVRLFLLSLQ